MFLRGQKWRCGEEPREKPGKTYAESHPAETSHIFSPSSSQFSTLRLAFPLELRLQSPIDQGAFPVEGKDRQSREDLVL